MDTKLVHQDARLYLISHASLHKRGFAPLAGMASESVIQMLVAQEHRLVIPFSVKSLQSTLAGTCMPMQHGAGEDSFQETARGTQFASSSKSSDGTHGYPYPSPDGAGGGDEGRCRVGGAWSVIWI